MLLLETIDSYYSCCFHDFDTKLTKNFSNTKQMDIKYR